jgi:hypothetical protein
MRGDFCCGEIGSGSQISRARQSRRSLAKQAETPPCASWCASQTRVAHAQHSQAAAAYALPKGATSGGRYASTRGHVAVATWTSGKGPSSAR